MQDDSVEKRRKALGDFMARHGLKPTPWARAAGVSDGAIRAFMKGQSDSLTARTYEKLAEAARVSPAELCGWGPIGGASDAPPDGNDRIDISFAYRLAAAREAAGLSTGALAKRLGLAEAEYGAIEQGAASPARILPKLARIAKITNTPLEAFFNGQVMTTATPPAPPVVELEGGETFTALPVFDVRVAAGAGALDEYEETTERAMFRSDWLRSVTDTPAQQLAILQVDGDSMWTTLHHGDHVLVDRAQQRYMRDGIYVFDIGDGLQIKRVAMHPTKGTLTLKSDNPEYPTFEEIDPAEVRFVGRVIWLGRRV